MDGPLSPTSAMAPGPNRSRQSYSLFPTVNATPPASPVALQQATFSRVYNRRRSTSLDRHAQQPTGRLSGLSNRSQNSLHSSTSSRNSHKESLQDALLQHQQKHPMTTVDEVQSVYCTSPTALPADSSSSSSSAEKNSAAPAVSASKSTSNTTTAPPVEVRAAPNVRDRSNSATSQSILSDGSSSNRSSSSTHEITSPHSGIESSGSHLRHPQTVEGHHPDTIASTSPLFGREDGPDLEFPATPSFQANRFRFKPGPGLRIAIQQAPSPATSDPSQQQGSQTPVRQPDAARIAKDMPVDRHTPLVSPLPLPSGGRDVISSSRPVSPRSGIVSPIYSEFNHVSPDVSRPTTPGSTKSASRTFARDLAAKPLPPIQLSPTNFDSLGLGILSTPLRVPGNASTTAPPKSPKASRFAPRTSHDDAMPRSPLHSILESVPEARGKTSPPSPVSRLPDKQRRLLRSSGVDSALPDPVPSQPARRQLRTKYSEPALSSRAFERKPIPSQQNPPSLHTNTSSISSVLAEATSKSRPTSSKSAKAELVSDAMSRVRAARAKVAALQQTEPNVPSTLLVERSRSPAPSEGNTQSRLVTPASIGRKPSTFSDPAATIQELAEQTEALQLRYAKLKTERQQLSNGIVAKLQQSQYGPEYTNLLLEEQLSLAAISSSMDICFAKLKALDCRKEEVVAAVLAQITPGESRKLVKSGVSVASYTSFSSRKHSMGPSTAGLTSDFGDLPSLTRRPSCSSDTDLSEYQRLSHGRQSSRGSETGLRGENPERQMDTTGLDTNLRRNVPPLTPVDESSSPREATQHSAQSSSGDSAADGSHDNTTEDSREDYETRPSSPASEGLPAEELFDARPKRIRINAAKAAKILGLLARSANGKDSSSSGVKVAGADDDDITALEDAFNDGEIPELEFEIYSDPPPPARLKKIPATAATRAANPAKKQPHAASATPVKSALVRPTFDALASFPPPPPPPPQPHPHPSSSSILSTNRKYDAPLPALPPLPGWEAGNDVLRMKINRSGSTATTSTLNDKRRRAYSARTIQTIQVYMEDT